MNGNDERNDEKVFEIVCPHCGTVIWVDGENKNVLKTERAARKKESLDDLLAREKTKQDSMASKFEATASLEKQKKDKARDAFEKAFTSAGEPAPDKE
jgi:Zn-finger nucleic acid-binding protein